MEEKTREQKKHIIVELMNHPNYVPMKQKELAIIMQVPKSSRQEFKQMLDELVEEGKISISPRKKYTKSKFPVIIGTFQANIKGFGFVSLEDTKEDVFIASEYVEDALDGDRVQIALLSDNDDSGRGNKREGKIIRVLERRFTEVVGTFQRNKNFGFVIPDNPRITKDIFIALENINGAVNGHKVVAEILNYGSQKKKPEGRIKEILGHRNDPGMDILSIAKAYGMETEFPQEVVRQLVNIPEVINGKEIALARLDLREWQTVTIDGEDAKDLDDAITLKKEGSHYYLGVHIADVSHYVTERSPLDREALKRGTSVYLIDRVIPMLPPKLSNGICSLNEGCDRLALSCLMEIDERGVVVGHRIAETVICVDRRMTYTAVKKILTDQDEQQIQQYQSFVPMFQLMEELSKLLRKRRFARGAIDFDFPEAKILLDEKGIPVKIIPYERNVATKIIEDFMLLANETIAESYFWQEIPFVYRVHENPDEEKMNKFGTFINNFGYSLHFSNGVIHPKELQKLLDKIEGTASEALISRLMLRSMKQAKYSTESSGHFGLSAPYYCHFTSPIRRYPDLQIHRIIKENIRKGISPRRMKHYEEILPEVAAQSSHMERRAADAEREVEKLKKAQYMSKHLGEVFDGVISGVTKYGIYVELENTVEGLIHVTDLIDDYYIFDENSYSLIGETTKKVYKLGQKIRVEVETVDPVLKTIQFVLEGESSHSEIKELEEILRSGDVSKLEKL